MKLFSGISMDGVGYVGRAKAGGVGVVYNIVMCRRLLDFPLLYLVNRHSDIQQKFSWLRTPAKLPAKFNKGLTRDLCKIVLPITTKPLMQYVHGVDSSISSDPHRS